MGKTQAANGRQHSVRLRVNDDELKFLRRMAAADDRTISYVLRRALREFHDRNRVSA